MTLSVRTLAIAALFLTSAPAIAAAPVTGKWFTTERDSIIEIGNCGTKICGRIAKILKPVQGGPPTDRNNPDAALRTRPILGLPILLDFTDAGSEWRGQIYDPRRGRVFRSTMALGPGGVLRVKGCIAVFCQTQEWRRAQ